jgi:hypothetical protein
MDTKWIINNKQQATRRMNWMDGIASNMVVLNENRKIKQ